MGKTDRWEVGEEKKSFTRIENPTGNSETHGQFSSRLAALVIFFSLVCVRMRIFVFSLEEGNLMCGWAWIGVHHFFLLFCKKMKMLTTVQGYKKVEKAFLFSHKVP